MAEQKHLYVCNPPKKCLTNSPNPYEDVFLPLRQQLEMPPFTKYR